MARACYIKKWANFMSRNDGQKPWSFRRNIVALTLAFCAICVLFVMIHGAADAETGKTIVASAFSLAAGVIGSYIFAATWDDKGKPV